MKRETMKSIAVSLAITLLVPQLGVAQPPAAGAPSIPTMTESVAGEVRKVDKDARKITLRHAEIKSLDMPAMTMVFRVKDPTMLDNVKAGDRVLFKAEGSDGSFTLTEIERAK